MFPVHLTIAAIWQHGLYTVYMYIQRHCVDGKIIVVFNTGKKDL